MLLGLTTLIVAASAGAADDKKTDAPEGHVVLFKLSAEGVQIYDAKQKKDNAREYEWSFKAPEAALFDVSGKKVGTHSAGPTWAVEGSKVVAVVPPMASVPRQGTIPELLLKVKAVEGKGLFDKVTYIRRVETSGGAAPPTCDAAYAGTELRVPYRATYLFYGPKP
jgi:hypothetical protein